MNEQSKPQLWLASNNAHKIKELAAMLPGVEIHTPKELAHCFSVEETGKSFAENAAIKARALFDLVGQPVISDDSGLEVKALNNGPGIYSSRYLGEQTDYAIKNQAIIEAVNGLGGSREARYVCALAYIDQTGKEQIFEGEMQGEIAKAPSGSNGFGYDPIFISKQFGISNGDLDPALKNAHSHRAKALQAFLKAWKKQQEIELKKAENQAKEPEQREGKETREP